MTSTIHYTTHVSPLGPITLAATASGLCGLYFAGQKHWPQESVTWHREDGPRFAAAHDWLTDYFAGRMRRPPPLDFAAGTAFQRRVWRALQVIPHGETVTYRQLAIQIQSPRAVRAVGAAVGRNPVSVIVPCHRVISSRGALTGYAGGLERKRWLLEHEGATCVATSTVATRAW